MCRWSKEICFSKFKLIYFKLLVSFPFTPSLTFWLSSKLFFISTCDSSYFYNVTLFISNHWYSREKNGKSQIHRLWLNLSVQWIEPYKSEIIQSWVKKQTWVVNCNNILVQDLYWMTKIKFHASDLCRTKGMEKSWHMTGYYLQFLPSGKQWFEGHNWQVKRIPKNLFILNLANVFKVKEVVVWF